VAAIVQRLEGNEEAPGFEDKSEQFLESLACDRLEFVIASVDVVGSTRLATTLAQEKYARLISTVLSELGEIIPKFHGYVLKYTGDGLIAYFPSPSFITMNDLALDCVLTMRGLVHNGINPLLEQRNYPVIDIRMGIDSGEAYVVTVGSPETKKHMDVIGGVVSLACKIQGLAKPGEICMGETTERNLHVAWRQLCEPVDCGPNWSYKERDGNFYRVFRFKAPS
jgi:adenylate cyclase